MVFFKCRWGFVTDPEYSYDAGNHTVVDIDIDGDTYSKSIDVFDVEGLGKEGTLEREMTDFVTKYAKPYIMATLWYKKQPYDK